MAKRKDKSDERLKKMKGDSCLNCRMADWKANSCLKRRIDIAKSATVFNCDYWRKPLEV